MKYIDYYSSKIGVLTIIATNNYLEAILFDNKKPTLKTNPNNITKQTKIWLDYYFNNHKEVTLNITLQPKGTDYQKRVWDLLLSVKFGQLKTYKDIKEMYEKKHKLKTSSIAIGQAISRNPIPIIIPCHRIIGSNGKLTGYAGGLDKKEILLNHEIEDSI